MKFIKRIVPVAAIILLCLLANTAYAADNLALGKDTWACSKYTEDDTYAPKNVTNGNYFDIWSMGTIKLEGTLGGYNYVAVDLGDLYMIDSVKAVTRRGLDDANARSGWVIQVANNRNFSDAVTIASYPTPIAYQNDYLAMCAEEEPYRYVRVASKRYLTVAEIEVFGEKYDPVTMNRKTGFVDAEGKEYQGAALLLANLDIMSGMNKNEFGGEKLLTRAQAARIMVGFSRLEINKAEPGLFSDIYEGHWAEDYVYTAYKNGIISADTMFRPDDYVTDKEFLKMVMYAMGYGDFIERKGGWDKGVYDAADRLSLEKHAGTVHGENINRAQAALILYNALRTPLCTELTFSADGSAYFTQNDKTMIEEKFGYKIVEGLLQENSNTSLIRESESTSGHIKVNGENYYDTNQMMELWLGMNVGIAVDIEDNKTVLCGWINSRENEVTRVYYNADDIITKASYKYRDESDRNKTLKLDSEMYLVKNNSAITDWTEDDLKVIDGYIEFTDNDTDGDYDVAMCFEPRYIVASSAAMNDGKFDLVSVNGELVTGKDLCFIKITKNGKNTTAGKIKKNDIVKVYISKNKRSIWADVVEKSIIGEIEGMTEEEILIAGQEIELTQHYLNNKEKTDTPVIGKTATILLDDLNRMVWIVRGSQQDSSDTIGFVVKIRQGEDYELEPTKIRIFSQYGGFNTFEIAPRIKVDGISLTKAELAERVLYNGLDIEGQFVMYRVNKDGLLNMLDTEAAGNESNSKIVKHAVGLGTTVTGIFNMYDAGGIFQGSVMLQPLKAKTVSFTIPMVNGEPGGEDYESYYKVGNAEGTWPRLVQIYDRTEFYGLDENDYPAFGVKYKDYAGAAVSGAREIDEDDAPGMIVDKVIKTVNSDDMPVYRISGYELAGGASVSYTTQDSLDNCYLSGKLQNEQSDWLDDDRYIDIDKADGEELQKYVKGIDKIKRGDIIRYQLQGGEINALECVYDAYSLDEKFASVENYYAAGETFPTTPSAEFRLMYGKAGEVNSEVLRLEVGESGGQMRKLNILYNDIQNVFVCDGELRKTTGTNIPAEAIIGSATVMYSREGVSRAVIIYR